MIGVVGELLHYDILYASAPAKIYNKFVVALLLSTFTIDHSNHLRMSEDGQEYLDELN